MALFNPLSQVQQAFNDTLIRKAEGEAFDSLAEMYGVPRLDYIEVKYWRKALQHVALGPRGSLGATFAFVREALRKQDKAYQVNVDPDPAKKNRIYWVAGGPAAGFTFKDLYRFWEIDGEVYFSTGWKGTSPGAAPWAYLEMSKYRGPYWTACDWSKDTTLIAGVPTQRAATRLPFTCKSGNAMYKLYIEADTFTVAPPMYIQIDYGWAMQYANANPVPLVDWFPSTIQHVGDLEGAVIPYSGLFPVTFGIPSQSEWVVDETATLKRLDVFADQGEPGFPARGGNYVVTLMLNGVATALTATLGAAATSAFGAGNIATAPGDKLALKVTSGAGVNKSLIRPRFQVHGERLGGQPIGGEVLPDATAQGDQTNGPYPWYLNDAGVAGWKQTLEVLLAAGVVPEVYAFTFSYPW
jgi:hypothetical protein